MAGDDDDIGDLLGTPAMSDSERLLRLELAFKQMAKDFKVVRKVAESLNMQSMLVRGGLIFAVAFGGIMAWGSNLWGTWFK